MSCLRILSLLVALLAVALAWAILASPMSGTLPCTHVGIPYGYKESDIPDLKGRVVLVTGANVGLGRGTAVLLARKGASVVITARSQKKCDGAVADVRARAGEDFANAPVECIVMELSSLSSVQEAVVTLRPRLEKLGGLHALVLNAGVMACPYTLSADGIEQQFAVNHLGHFALYRGLEDILVKSAPATVVSVSSVAHVHTSTHGADDIYRVLTNLTALNDKSSYDPANWYGYSKLANILFAREVNRRLSDKQVFANAVHPGGVSGNLNRHATTTLSKVTGLSSSAVNAFNDFVIANMYWTEETGALTSVYPAVSHAALEGKIQAEYLVPVARVWTSNAHGANETLGRALWKFSEQLLERSSRE